jgi:hypothetical protein
MNYCPTCGHRLDYCQCAKKLIETVDFKINERTRTVHVTCGGAIVSTAAAYIDADGWRSRGLCELCGDWVDGNEVRHLDR